MLRSKVLCASVVALAAAAFAGCSDDDDDFIFTGPGATEAQAEVFAVSGPTDDERVESVIVEVNRIDLIGEDELGNDVDQTVFDATQAGGPRRLDLLTLRSGQRVLIARDEVPPGTYDQMIVYISDAEVVYDVGGTPTTFTTTDDTLIVDDPATPAQEDTLPVPITFALPGGVDIDPGETEEILLDFDLGQAITVVGDPADPTRLVFAPGGTTRPAEGGSIAGVVRSNAGTPNDPADDFALGDATITLLQNDQPVTTTATDAQGAFVIEGLEAGQYELLVNEETFEEEREPVSITGTERVTADITLTPETTTAGN